MIRLQKFLAESGAASRRRAEELIAAGKVSVNGQIAALGAKVGPNDVVLLNGKPLGPARRLVYIALNKPEGVITSAADQFGRKTVLDLVPNEGLRLFPVGRLDYATSGLVLLTNDGSLANLLTHPSYGVPKTYVARLAKPLGAADVRAFEEGVVIDRRKTMPARLKIVGEKTAEITIKEGRNRQLRKMFEVLGNDVIALKRIAMGEILLGSLKTGEYRHLQPDEMKYINSILGKTLQ